MLAFDVSDGSVGCPADGDGGVDDAISVLDNGDESTRDNCFLVEMLALVGVVAVVAAFCVSGGGVGCPNGDESTRDNRFLG